MRRTYKETYFWMLIICVLVTVGSDQSGMSIEQMIEYAEGFIKRAIHNMNSLVIWIVPTVVIIKKEITAWRTALYEKEIAIANASKEKQCEKLP